MRTFSRVVSSLCALALLVTASPQTPSSAADRAATRLSSEAPRIRDASRHVLLQSTTSTSSTKHAATDTFYLYGGPDEPTEGRFQDSNGVSPDRQGWIGVDRTDIGPYWQVSTFNAETLNDHGAGNLAAWCGRTSAQQPGWASAPGYGNDWTEALAFDRTVAEPDSAQTIDLDFFFHYETEPSYDFFRVEYDSAGSWATVYEVSGSNEQPDGVFAAPGVQYSQVTTRTIEYVGGDYGGDGQDEIRLRLSFESDGAGSDQDGLWPTDAGAVQVDDVSVSWSGGTHEEDFESGAFDLQSWYPVKDPFFGDFSKVWARFDDIDPCRSNRTPAMGFVDAGQVVNNAASAALIPGYPVQTDGEANPLFWEEDYGVPGGWVVNYTGGLARAAGLRTRLSIANDVWSPPISWDLPGSEDDAAGVAGVAFRYDLWAHLPLDNYMVYRWAVRWSADGGTAWSNWADRGYFYYGGGIARWISRKRDVSDLVATDTISHLQIRLGVYQPDGIFFGGWGATPAPFFDNVAVLKYEMGGPRITAEPVHLAQTGFPPSGGLDASTAAARDLLDVPFDMALDIAPEEAGVPIDPGDSIVVNVRSLIPGAGLADVRMRWVLDKNPLFEDALRAAPARPQDENVDTSDPLRWTGEVTGTHPTDSAGQPVETRWFFDLPDADFLYPGDVLRYAIEATDTDGRVSTLPTDVTGLLGGSGYPQRFSVRALPSLQDADGTQPSTLIYQDFGHRAGENELFAALGQLGLVEGTDYDVYATLQPWAMAANGLGSTGGHGAAASQLAGYDTIVYLSGDQDAPLLSDGIPGVYETDKSDDVGVLTAWHDQPAPRHMVYFGNNLLSRMGSPAQRDYLQNVMGVGSADSDVRSGIDGQHNPTVAPVDAAFPSTFVAYGGCPDYLYFDGFDRVEDLQGAVIAHAFLDPGGNPYPGIAASALYDRTVDGHRKVDLSFPFGLRYVRSSMHKAPGNVVARARLLQEVFDLFGVAGGSGTPVAAPAASEVRLRVHPNPFNPATTIILENLPKGAKGSVRIYNLRGELVRTLHEGEFARPTLRWEGRDDRGVRVASGVYVVEIRAGDFAERRKIALLR